MVKKLQGWKMTNKYRAHKSRNLPTAHNINEEIVLQRVFNKKHTLMRIRQRTSRIFRNYTNANTKWLKLKQQYNVRSTTNLMTGSKSIRFAPNDRMQCICVLSEAFRKKESDPQAFIKTLCESTTVLKPTPEELLTVKNIGILNKTIQKTSKTLEMVMKKMH